MTLQFLRPMFLCVWDTQASMFQQVVTWKHLETTLPATQALRIN